MPSKEFEAAVRAELAAAKAEHKRIEAHIIRLSTFLGEEKQLSLDWSQVAPKVAGKRGPGRPKGSKTHKWNGNGKTPPRQGLGSFKNKPFHSAVRELLQEYAGGLSSRELREELTKRGVKVKGKARLSTRISLAVHQFRKAGKVKTTDDKTHVWVQKAPAAVRSEGVKVLSAD